MKKTNWNERSDDCWLRRPTEAEWRWSDEATYGDVALRKRPVHALLAVLFGANLSFVTPMGYQTNLLIMNAAGYTFGDFVRVGLPLAVLLWVSLTVLLVIAYPL